MTSYWHIDSLVARVEDRRVGQLACTGGGWANDPSSPGLTGTLWTPQASFESLCLATHLREEWGDELGMPEPMPEVVDQKTRAKTVVQRCERRAGTGS